jgi:hypothetical protein
VKQSATYVSTGTFETDDDFQPVALKREAEDEIDLTRILGTLGVRSRAGDGIKGIMVKKGREI